MDVRFHPLFQDWLDRLGAEMVGDGGLAELRLQADRWETRPTMTDKADHQVPVDRGEVADVAEGAWQRDDSPDRYFERLTGDRAARAHFEAVLAEIHDHQATLAQVRKAKSLTQSTIGALLEMDQSEVSRLERRSDMLLTTLRSFIQAAGGELHLIASFPNSSPVHLLIGPEDPSPKGTTPTASSRREG